MNILLVVMSQSPFNQSIWMGIAKGFTALGCSVEVVDAQKIPTPQTLQRPIDILFSVHGANVPSELIQTYRDKGAKTAVYLLDEPYEVDRTIEWAQHYEWVFSVDKATVPLHCQLAKASHLPLGYDPEVFNPDVQGIPSRILILGSPFSARMPYLTALRDNWGEIVTWVGPGWKEFSPAGQHYPQYVSPSDCARFYRGADIAINIHRDSFWSHFGELNQREIEATHLNPRFWETAACGAFALTSYRSDIDVYATESPSFASVEQMTTKINYFLGNRTARERISKRILQKMKPHKYVSRCEKILETLS